MNDDVQSQLTPVSIITGFLGAGKTTLLNSLLANPNLSDTLVIVNEFGEIGLDHLIVAAPSENTILLKNGCLCCMVRGELTDTLLDLARRQAVGQLAHFGRVLVETSGIADPLPILQSLLGDDEIGERYRLGAVITVVDAVNGAHQIDEGFEAPKQIAVADRLVISKIDLVPPSDVAELEELLSDLNPSAAIFRSAHGQGLSEAWLGNAGNVLDYESGVATAPEKLSPDINLPVYRHGEIRTFSLSWDTPATTQGLQTWLHLLASFNGPDLLRMKGIINVEGRPVLVNAVQRLIHEPRVLESWPTAKTASTMIFITRRLERQHIEPTLLALGYHHLPAHGLLDPQRYSQFVTLAQRFRPSPSEDETLQTPALGADGR